LDHVPPLDLGPHALDIGDVVEVVENGVPGHQPLLAGRTAAQAAPYTSAISGSDRRRRPVASKMALAIAGATAIIGVSPAPADGKLGRCNRTTSIGGTSEIRGTR
jgi:hypothetical protein